MKTAKLLFFNGINSCIERMTTMTLCFSHTTLSNRTLNSISRAHQLFDKSPNRDPSEIGYKTLLLDYSNKGLNREALTIFLGLVHCGYPVDESSLSCTLKVCGFLFDKTVGKQVHCRCIKSGLLDDVSVGTSLIEMYMKTEDICDGRRVFDEMGVQNVESCTALLVGYTQNGLNEPTLDLFSRMHRNGVKLNPLMFVSVFGPLSNLGMVDHKGRSQIHTMVIKSGLESSTCLCNSLINMYSKSVGGISHAKVIFDCLVDKDVLTWNSMIYGYVMNGLDLEAVKLFHSMRLEGENLTKPLFVSLIKSCSNLKEVGFVRQLHGWIVKCGLEFDHNVGTSLMMAYNKCKEASDAFKMFSTLEGNQNVVSWTAVIGGFLKNGAEERAVSLFSRMCKEGVRPNDFTYSTILTAQQPCISIQQVHAQVVKMNFEKAPTVGTTLLNAYVKVGNIGDASKVFELVDEKDIVTWSALLIGYVQMGETERAVEIFRKLRKEGIMPNEYTFSSVIHACTVPTAPTEQGKQFHAMSIKMRFNDALCVSSALVTMYAKRGNIESAVRVFKRQRERDLISWNSMVSGFAQHGRAENALQIFDDMERQQIQMDDVTFIAVITACTHAGLVDEGQRFFDRMVKRHRISPTMEHYSCMVDLYSRAGMLGEAMDIIKRMPFPADATVWRTLLAACHVQRNLEVGELAAEKLMSLQPQDSVAYVLLSNIYAAKGNWIERAVIRQLMDKRKVKKQAGYSWVEVKNKTHSFLAGDVSHPMSSHIYSKLEELSARLKDMGYRPDTNYVLQDVEEEHKAAILSRHSERLAIAFALISTPTGTAIHVIKNLRVCGDCHNVIKLISVVERREVVVRDLNRFHHFNDGVCSCGDYW